MKDEKYAVYVQTNESGYINGINSSAFVPPECGTKIGEGIGDRFHYAQRHYFVGGLYTEDGIPRYKLVDGNPVERTADEIEADRAAIPPARSSALEQLRADVDFLAIMHGVEL